MSPKITAIADRAPKKLAALIIEARDDIESAVVAAAAEAQAQESKAKLRLTFSITINLDSNALEYGLGWNVPHKLTATETLPDPNQPDLIPEAGE